MVILDNLRVSSMWTAKAMLTCSSRYLSTLKSQMYDIFK